MASLNVRHERIAIESAASRDVFPNVSLQVVLAASRNDSGANLTTTFKQSDNRSLASNSGLIQTPTASTGTVHVPRLATDKSFVHFDFTTAPAELNGRPSLEYQSEPMKHEPRGLLTNAKRSAEFVTADSVFAVDHHPQGRKPLSQTKRRILKNRPDLDAKLLPAFLALPTLLRSKVIVFGVPTRGAFRLTLMPSHPSYSLNTHIFTGVISDSFLQGLWVLCVVCHAQNAITHFLVSQGNYCPSDCGPMRSFLFKMGSIS
jgi:hypothetical protein